MMTLPNILTIMRLLAAPCLALLYSLFDRPVADWLALLLFILASITDYVDGHLARKWNQTTRLGAALDPIADKAMVLTALAVIYAIIGSELNYSLVVTVPIAVIFFREVFVSGLREFLGSEREKLAVTKLAKWKTTLQMIAISFLFLALAINFSIPYESQSGSLARLFYLLPGLGLLWGAALLTGLTGYDYFQKALPLLKEDRA